jgi:hypothetical protein
VKECQIQYSILVPLCYRTQTSSTGMQKRQHGIRNFTCCIPGHVTESFRVRISVFFVPVPFCSLSTPLTLFIHRIVIQQLFSPLPCRILILSFHYTPTSNELSTCIHQHAILCYPLQRKPISPGHRSPLRYH